MSNFVVKKVYSFPWPVKLKLPNNGQYEDQIVNFIFKLPKNDELKEIFKKFNETKLYADFCKQVILGWTELKDEDQNEFPFNEENLGHLLNNNSFGQQIFDQFFEITNGAVAKN